MDNPANSLSIDTHPDTQLGEEVILKGYLRIRNNHYYYRRRIPNEFRPKFFKGREISKALKMAVKPGNLRDARLAAKDWDMKVDKIFLICRIKVLPDANKHEAIKNELYPSRIKETPSAVKPVRLNDIFKDYYAENTEDLKPKSKSALQYSFDLAIKVIGNTFQKIIHSFEICF